MVILTAKAEGRGIVFDRLHTRDAGDVAKVEPQGVISRRDAPFGEGLADLVSKEFAFIGLVELVDVAGETRHAASFVANDGDVFIADVEIRAGGDFILALVLDEFVDVAISASVVEPIDLEIGFAGNRRDAVFDGEGVAVVLDDVAHRVVLGELDANGPFTAGDVVLHVDLREDLAEERNVPSSLILENIGEKPGVIIKLGRVCGLT